MSVISQDRPHTRGRDYGSGSNVDIGTPQQVYEDLLIRELQVDTALEALHEAVREHIRAKGDYLEAWKTAYVQCSIGEEKITKAKTDAEAMTTKERLALDSADAIKAYALENLRSKRTILTSVQSRAAMVKKQLELELMSTR